MIKVDCAVENELFSALAEEVFKQSSLSGDAVVEVDFVTPDEIHEINRAERGVDRPTDVLSFPALDEIKPFTVENYPFEYDGERKAVTLGSILICGEIADEQAKEYGHSSEREKCYLFVHGLLHLLCYDHIDETMRAQMREKEENILNKLEIKR